MRTELVKKKSDTHRSCWSTTGHFSMRVQRQAVAESDKHDKDNELYVKIISNVVTSKIDNFLSLTHIQFYCFNTVSEMYFAQKALTYSYYCRALDHTLTFTSLLLTSYMQ